MFFAIYTRAGNIIKSKTYDSSSHKDLEFISSVMEGIARNDHGWVQFYDSKGFKVVINYDNVDHMRVQEK